MVGGWVTGYGYGCRTSGRGACLDSGWVGVSEVRKVVLAGRVVRVW